MNLEKALTDGTFKEARQAILDSDDVSRYDLQHLAIKAGLDETMAHLVVTAVMVATKNKLIKELKKQTNSMLYWVERA